MGGLLGCMEVLKMVELEAKFGYQSAGRGGRSRVEWSSSSRGRNKSGPPRFGSKTYVWPTGKQSLQASGQERVRVRVREREERVFC
jgi:hypothetical protein